MSGVDVLTQLSFAVECERLGAWSPSRSQRRSILFLGLETNQHPRLRFDGQFYTALPTAGISGQVITRCLRLRLSYWSLRMGPLLSDGTVVPKTESHAESPDSANTESLIARPAHKSCSIVQQELTLRMSRASSSCRF